MARQKLGQHFLISTKVLDRLVQALRAGPGAEESLAVEIGPGRGALTEYLLREFGRVAAVEIDRDLVPQLRERWGPEQGLEVIEANAMDIRWDRFGPGVLAGNLPYYVATPLISHYLRRPGGLRHAVFLIQKEVAERIAAKPGSREYGYFSVECQLLATAQYLFTVPPGAFRPPPKVESAVIRLTPALLAPGTDTESFLTFASACFRQKRKTLRNNLMGAYDCEGVSGISLRAEQLSVAELRELHASMRPLNRIPPERIRRTR